MTASGRRRAFGIGAALVAVAVAVWLLLGSTGSTPLESADADGLRGLRLLLESRGATVTEVDAGSVDAATAKQYDVVFVPDPAGVHRDQRAAWHRYVAAGGRLVLGSPDRPRPTSGGMAAPTKEAGTCDAFAAEMPRIHLGGAAPHAVYDGERSCYGDGALAVVTVASCQDGEQFTLASPDLFANEVMGAPTEQRNRPEERGNATLAAASLEVGDATRIAVAFEGVDVDRSGEDGPGRGEPRCGEVPGDDPLWQVPTFPPGGGRYPDGGGAGEGGNGEGNGGSGGSGGTVDGRPDGSGTPGGAGGSQDGPGAGGQSGAGGDSDESSGDPARSDAEASPSLFDFVSDGVKLALAQLLAVLVWYAWRRSRRDGVVVEERRPVELRSSRLVEAVGGMRRRGGELDRATAELRTRAVGELARDLRLPASTPAPEVAAAAAARTGHDPQHVAALLMGGAVPDEATLVQLSSDLRALRDAVAHVVRVGGSG